MVPSLPGGLPGALHVTCGECRSLFLTVATAEDLVPAESQACTTKVLSPPCSVVWCLARTVPSASTLKLASPVLYCASFHPGHSSN